MGRRRGICLCLAGMLTLALYGCSGGEVDYEIDGGASESVDVSTEEGGTEGSPGEGGSGLFSDETEWKEKWTADNGGNTVQFTVDAKITVPDADQMSVVEVKRVEIDEAYARKAIDTLFPGDEVTERGQDYEGLLVDHDGVVFHFLYGEYEARANGWLLSFAPLRTDRESWTKLCPQGLGDADFFGFDDVEKEDTGENQCAMSEQEALALAESTLSSLGLSGLVLEEVRPLVWYGTFEDRLGENSTATDGYRLTYGFGIGNESFRSFGTEEDYNFEEELYGWSDREAENPLYSMKAGIEIDITDYGVVGMELTNPIEITGVTREVELLPLEKVEDIIVDELDGHIDRYLLDAFNYYTDMELIYFRLRDEEKEGCYSYVPLWRLASRFTSDEYTYSINKAVLVNAIDGSIYYLKNEYGQTPYEGEEE